MNELDKAVIDAARKVCCVGLGTGDLIELNQAIEALDREEEFAVLNRLVRLFRREAEVEWLPSTKQPYVPVFISGIGLSF